eukprot:251152-Chlamydomonas_euryale.AAC.4
MLQMLGPTQCPERVTISGSRQQREVFRWSERQTTRPCSRSCRTTPRRPSGEWLTHRPDGICTRERADAS